MSEKLKATANRLLERKLMQVDELDLLEQIQKNKRDKLVEEADIAKLDILLDNISKQRVIMLAEADEFREIANSLQ